MQGNFNLVQISIYLMKLCIAKTNFKDITVYSFNQ